MDVCTETSLPFDGCDPLEPPGLMSPTGDTGDDTDGLICGIAIVGAGRPLPEAG